MTVKKKSPKGGGGTPPIGGGVKGRLILRTIAKQLRDLAASFDKMAKSPIGGGGTSPIGGGGTSPIGGGHPPTKRK